MPTNGSGTFTDAVGYEAVLRDMLDLVVPQPRDFRAHITWVELPSLHLLRVHETSSRIAYMTLPRDRVFVIFPRQQDSLLIVAGVELRFGEIMFHSCGDSLHQRTIDGCDWGSISLAPASLKTFGWSIAGRNLVPPDVSQILRPLPRQQRKLLRLHARASRVAETAPDRISNREVVRSLEQELILSLINCLTAAEVRQDLSAMRQQMDISKQLEAMLAANRDRRLSARDICRTIGISDSALRSSCARLLGMSARNYQRFQRLKFARADLMRTGSGADDVADILQRYGFTDLQRFAVEYWNAYGELPPIPPRILPKGLA
jgi:AraC-like DNA-binding protein